MIVAINKDAEAPIFRSPTTGWWATCSSSCRSWSKALSRSSRASVERRDARIGRIGVTHEHTAPRSRTCCSCMNELAGLDAGGQAAGLRRREPDTVDAVLEEAREVRDRTCSPAQRRRATAKAPVWKDGEVTTPAGLQGSLPAVRRGRLEGPASDPRVRRAGPAASSSRRAVEEMWNAANLAFALCPLLTHGAIEALELRGSDELQGRRYLPKMIAGEWTGTMNLTEPQAGSRPAAGAHARRAAGRRHLQALRHKDLHHLRRARHAPRTSSTWCSRARRTRPKA